MTTMSSTRRLPAVFCFLRRHLISNAQTVDPGVAYITNQDGGVIVIDLDTMEIKGAAKEDDDNEEKIPGRIAIVDLKKGKVIKEIIDNQETEGIEFSRDGKQMIVTNESDNSIIDADKLEVTKRIADKETPWGA